MLLIELKLIRNGGRLKLKLRNLTYDYTYITNVNNIKTIYTNIIQSRISSDRVY